MQLLLPHRVQKREDTAQMRVKIATMDQGVVQEDSSVASKDVTTGGGVFGGVSVDAGHQLQDPTEQALGHGGARGQALRADSQLELTEACRESGQPRVFVSQTILEEEVRAVEGADGLGVAQLVDDVGPLRRGEVLCFKYSVQSTIVDDGAQGSDLCVDEEQARRRARVAWSNPPCVQVIGQDRFRVGDLFLTQASNAGVRGYEASLLQVAASVDESEGW